MSNNPFLEERIEVDALSNGASYGDEYEVEIITVKGGAEYRRLLNPFPVRTFQFTYLIEKNIIYAKILNLWHRCFGRFKGFRVKCMDDFSTNNFTGVPTMLDQTLIKISSGVYQLRKIYGTSGGERTIFKPVSGSVVLAKNGVSIASGFTVDTTTGLVTISPAPTTESITGGCYFDIPVRFNTKVEVGLDEFNLRSIDGVELIELINP